MTCDCECIKVLIHRNIYLLNSSGMGRMCHEGQFWSGVKLVWIQFSFSWVGCLNKTKELGLRCYLSVAGTSK